LDEANATNLFMVKVGQGLLEKLVPILLVASIGLAFVVGVLWQKVSSLEGGSTRVSGTSGNTNTQPQAGGNEAQAPSNLDNLEAVVGSIQINTDKFKSCSESGKYKDRVESDYQAGIAAGVSGTPGNFIVNDKGETWFVPGAYPFDQVKIVVDIARGGDGTLPQGVEKLSSDRASKLTAISEKDHVRGNRSAKIKLVEYSDFECPFCQRFHLTAKQVLDEYGNDVAWVYRHFPLDQLHPKARPTAEASECVYELGGDEAFWKFTDEVFGV